MPPRALAFAALLALAPSTVSAQCLSDPKLEATFVSLAGAKSLPVEGSCCQKDVCGLPCPAAAPVPTRGYVIAVGLAIAVFCCIGFSTYFLVNGKAENFFVAGRSLSLPVIALTLAAQSIDSNALLGNVDLAYKYHFWDGAVLPIGLGLSLIINGVFSARFVHREHVLTVPDIYARYYGPVVEVVISLICCASFIALLAGNLVGMSTILGYLGGIEKPAAVFICGMVLYVYTISGGLFSVALTDVVQSIIGILGALVCAYWFIANAPAAPPPSIGFPGYVYPDEATSDLYEGVACVNDPSAWCYNAAKWCPSADDCTADNGAYPFGDQAIFYNEMSDPHGLTPFPNAIFFNWATIFILGFGNLAALDFQARCMAAKTEFIATAGCLIAGCLTFFTGIPFSYLGAITRYYYGPDSIHAAFEADTCSKALGLPTCGLWLPDPNAFLHLLTNQAPAFIGGWTLITIVAASMSTSDGSILALSTVLSHNVARKLPIGISEKNLLWVSRLAGLPVTLIACLVAISTDQTAYLLVVAFDIMLAGSIVPLLACFYTTKPSPFAALCCAVGGSLLRVILEFALPKDGYLILPWPGDEFLDYGAPADDRYPAFFDVPKELMWDPSSCKQERLADYTGVDSLASPLFGLIIFLVITLIERAKGSPIVGGFLFEPTPAPARTDEDEVTKEVTKAQA